MRRGWPGRRRRSVRPSTPWVARSCGSARATACGCPLGGCRRSRTGPTGSARSARGDRAAARLHRFGRAGPRRVRPVPAHDGRRPWPRLPRPRRVGSSADHVRTQRGRGRGGCAGVAGAARYPDRSARRHVDGRDHRDRLGGRARRWHAAERRRRARYRRPVRPRIVRPRIAAVVADSVATSVVVPGRVAAPRSSGDVARRPPVRCGDS